MFCGKTSQNALLLVVMGGAKIFKENFAMFTFTVLFLQFKQKNTEAQ